MRMGWICQVAVVGLLALPVAAQEPPVKSELEELKTQVAAQQRQIRELQEVLRRQAAALERLERQLGEGVRASDYESASNSPPVDDPPPQASLEERLQELENRVAENKTQDQSLLRRLGSFSFSGDLRVRYEPF
ncbi:MAG: SlyX family protein, partial [Terriglobia bacterium]